MESVGREFFRWKHFEGPWGHSDLFVAEADGEVVGFRGYMPWRLVAPHRTIRAVQAVDAATDPRFQGRGVHNVISGRVVEAIQRQLREAPDEASELTFGTPNQVSARATQRARGTAATYVTEVVGTFGVSVRLRRARTLGRRLGLRGEHAPVKAERAADVLDVADGLADLIGEWQAAESRLVTERSLEYLRWRYPRLLGYHAITEKHDGAIVGLAVFRIRQAGYGYEEARVLELLFRPGDRRCARRLLRKVARSTSAEWLTCCFPPGSGAHDAAARAGFKPKPHEMSLLVARTTGPRESYGNLDAWALTLGDVEELI